MKTDFYTKVLLTFIALFLGVLAFDKVYETAIPEAQAKTGKWHCSVIFLEGAYDRVGYLQEVANQKNWTFMTIVLNEKKEDSLFCGRP